MWDFDAVSSTTQLCCVLGAAALVYALYHILWKPLAFRRHFAQYGVKSFPYRPLLGQVNEVKSCDDEDRVMDFYMEGVRKYGFTHGNDMAWMSFLNVGDPELIKDILVKNKWCYQKSFEWMKEPLRPLLGDGLLMSEGGVWKAHRRALSPAFHFESLKSMVPLMVDAAQKCVAKWLDGIDKGSPIELDIAPHISNMTLEIVANAAFGPTFLSSQRVNDIVHHSLMVVLEDLQNRATSGIALTPILKHVPIPSYVRVKRGCTAIERELDIVIRDRRSGKNKPLVAKDLLDILLEASDTVDEESGQRLMTDRQVMDEAITFVFAAFETVANAFNWILYLVLSHPEVHEKCMAEVARVVGLGSSSRPVAYDDLKELNYIEAVIMESLRLRPPFPMLGKVAVKDNWIGGHSGFDPILIPAGTVVNINSYVVHRHPKHWPDAEEFKPQRWLEKHRTHMCAYLPFSEGQRNCLGKNFAMLEMKVMLTTILRQVALSLAPGQKVVGGIQKLNYVVKYGLTTRMERQK